MLKNLLAEFSNEFVRLLALSLAFGVWFNIDMFIGDNSSKAGMAISISSVFNLTDGFSLFLYFDLGNGWKLKVAVS